VRLSTDFVKPYFTSSLWTYHSTNVIKQLWPTQCAQNTFLASFHIHVTTKSFFAFFPNCLVTIRKKKEQEIVTFLTKWPQNFQHVFSNEVTEKASFIPSSQCNMVTDIFSHLFSLPNGRKNIFFATFQYHLFIKDASIIS
jgi:hypothetical protein